MADDDELNELFEQQPTPVARETSTPRPTRRLSKSESKSRKELVEALLINGVPEHRIEATLREQFSRTRHGDVGRIIASVRARWAEEEKNNRPHFKATAQRRLYTHIAKASKEANFAAVAALERLLSDVQGTKEAVEVNLNLDATVTEAVMHVVANLSTEEMDRITQEQREFRALRERAQAGESLPLMASGVAVPERKH